MTSEEIAFGIGIAVGVGVAIGVSAGIYYNYKKKRNNEYNDFRESSIDKRLETVKKEKMNIQSLLDTQSYVPILTPKDITAWFKEYKGELSGTLKMIVAYPTQKTLKGIGYESPCMIDSENNVIQLFYDENKNEVKKIRLINFEEIDSNLEAHLIESDGMIVITQ